MIVDKLENWTRYFDGEIWEQAFTYLAKIGPDEKTGRNHLNGETLYASVDHYNTKDFEACIFEAHRKYIDIQVMLDGEEFVDWMPVSEAEENIAYNEQSDVIFFNQPECIGGRILLQPGWFAIFFPEDAHMPQCAVEKPIPVKKVVVKVAEKAVGKTAQSCRTCKS